MSLLVSVIMVRSAMNMQDLGYFEISIFVVNALSVFWSQGIKNALFSYYPSRDYIQQKSVLSTVFWVLLGFSIVGGLLLYSCSHQILYWLTDVRDIPSLGLVALFFVVSIPAIMVENILFLSHQPRRLMQYSHWSHIGQVAVILLIAIFSPTISNFLIGFVFWSLVRLLYLVYLLVKDNCLWSYDGKVASLFLLFSVPLVFNNLLAHGMDLIDGLFVTHYFDTEFFPIFRYGAREMPFTSLLFSALSAAMIPVIMDKGLQVQTLKDRATKLMHIVFPVGIVAMMVSPLVFVLVYDEQFGQSALIFNVYLLILISRVLLPQTYNMALHQHKILVFSTAVEILVNIILSFWWVQYFGVYGLAMATVVAYLIQKLILIWYNQQYNDIKITQYIDVKWFVIYSILLVVSFIFTFKLYS